jgi:hypothetical protein
MKTRERISLSKYVCVGLCVTGLTVMAQQCWHLVNPALCGTECPAVPPDCIQVTCQSKQDCALIAYSLSGTLSCPTMGCYCFASQLTDTDEPNPNGEGTTPVCDLPSAITVAPPGCGGSSLTGQLGSGTCTD